MNILILSCNTGGGHNAAANALAEEILSHGDTATVLDYFCLADSRISHTVGNVYVEIVKKVPALFGFIYQLGMFVSRLVPKSPVYYTNGKMARYLASYLSKHPADAIVMPHLYPAETLTYMKRHNMPIPPTVAIMTDYTCIPFWEETDCDYYIVPDASLIPSIVKRGIAQEKLLTLGIPVSPRFSADISKAEARKQLSLPADGTCLLVAGGSMGAGHLLSFARQLLRATTSEQILLIAGNDEHLEHRLKDTFAHENRIRVIGFTAQMPLYMKACDLLFTKPGGLTSTEAAVCGIPLVHTDPIPGCETQNRRFFFSRGMCTTGKTADAQISRGLSLCHDASAAQKMVERQKNGIRQDSAHAIYELLYKLTRQS